MFSKKPNVLCYLLSTSAAILPAAVTQGDEAKENELAKAHQGTVVAVDQELPRDTTRLQTVSLIATKDSQILTECYSACGGYCARIDNGLLYVSDVNGIFVRTLSHSGSLSPEIFAYDESKIVIVTPDGQCMVYLLPDLQPLCCLRTKHTVMALFLPGQSDAVVLCTTRVVQVRSASTRNFLCSKIELRGRERLTDVLIIPTSTGAEIKPAGRLGFRKSTLLEYADWK